MRTTQQIRSDLGQAITKRASLWEELSHGPDPSRSGEAARLSRMIDDLWAELRAAQARGRFGSPELIHARARAEERLERDARRVRKAA
jgi:hypothetical protein